MHHNRNNVKGHPWLGGILFEDEWLGFRKYITCTCRIKMIRQVLTIAPEFPNLMWPIHVKTGNMLSFRNLKEQVWMILDPYTDSEFQDKHFINKPSYTSPMTSHCKVHHKVPDKSNQNKSYEHFAGQNTLGYMSSQLWDQSSNSTLQYKSWCWSHKGLWLIILPGVNIRQFLGSCITAGVMLIYGFSWLT